MGIFLFSESQPLSPPRFAALTERLRLQRAQDGGKIQRWGNNAFLRWKNEWRKLSLNMNCQVKVKDEKIKTEGHIRNGTNGNEMMQNSEPTEQKGTNGSSKTVERHTTCWHPSHPLLQPSHPPKLRQEVEILKRLRELENEAKDERIAVLEREIAEDKHIHALKVRIFFWGGALESKVSFVICWNLSQFGVVDLQGS